MLYNTTETTKNICCVKGEGAVDHSTVSKRFKKFHLGCKNLNNQARLGRAKTIDSKCILQSYWSKSSEWHLGEYPSSSSSHSLSSLWCQQKHPMLPDCGSHHENTAKFLIPPSICVTVAIIFFQLFCYLHIMYDIFSCMGLLNLFWSFSES